METIIVVTLFSVVIVGFYGALFYYDMKYLPSPYQHYIKCPRKPKRTLERWIVVYKSGVFNEVFTSEENAKENTFDEPHQIVKLTGEFEVEE